MNARLAELARIPFFMPLAAATLMLGVAMSFTAPYLSLFGVEQAGMTPRMLGLFMTLIAASGVATSAWAGKWSDRRGHHHRLDVQVQVPPWARGDRGVQDGVGDHLGDQQAGELGLAGVHAPGPEGLGGQPSR